MKNHYKYLIVILIVLTLLLGFFVGEVSAQTVASDNFNSGISAGWSNNGSAHPETFICGATGCNSVKMACTASETTTPGSGCTIVGNGQLSQSFAVTNGATYRVSIAAGVFTSGATPNGQVTLTATDGGSKTESISCSQTSCGASGSKINGSLSVTIVPQTSTLTVHLKGTQGGCTTSACHDPYVDDFVITQTATAPSPLLPPLLDVTCTVTPTTATVGDNVTWTADVIGGTASFTYTWSGDVSGTTTTTSITNSITKSYSTAGTKTGTVKVTDSSNPQQSATSSQCTATINAAGAISVSGSPSCSGTDSRIAWSWSGGSGSYTKLTLFNDTLNKSQDFTPSANQTTFTSTGLPEGQQFRLQVFDNKNSSGTSAKVTSSVCASPSPSGCTLSAPSSVPTNQTFSVDLSGPSGIYTLTCPAGDTRTGSPGDSFGCTAPSDPGSYTISATGPNNVSCSKNITATTSCSVTSNMNGPYIYTYKDTAYNNTNYTGVSTQWPQYFFCKDTDNDGIGDLCSYGTATGKVADAKRNDNTYCGYSLIKQPVKVTGQYSSLKLDSKGNPMVSYSDPNDQKLKILHCNDPNCTGIDESLNTSQDAGVNTSLVLDSKGNPIISYGDSVNGDLKLLYCNDPNCDPTVNGAESINTVDSKVGAGKTSLVLDPQGNPVISYSVPSFLKLAHCNDSACSGNNESIQELAFFGEHSSLKLDSQGNPVISYTDSINGGVFVMHCNDPNCDPKVAGAETINKVDPSGANNTSLKLDSKGNPVVAYGVWSDGSLKLLHCNDPNCDPKVAGAETINTVDTTKSGYLGIFISLTLDGGGFPVVSYLDSNNGDLKLLHCQDPDCGKTKTINTVDSKGNVGEYNSLTLDAKGNPVISYYDSTNNTLKVAHCNDVNCGGGNESISVPQTPTGADIPGQCRLARFPVDKPGAVSSDNYDSDHPFNQPLDQPVTDLPRVLIHADSVCDSYKAVTGANGQNGGQWLDSKGILTNALPRQTKSGQIKYDIWAELPSGRKFTRATYFIAGDDFLGLNNGSNPYKGPADQPRFTNFSTGSSKTTPTFPFGFTNPGQEPVCNGLSATPTTGERPLKVTFTPKAGSDADGTVAGYAYDFDGDGSIDQTETTTNTVTHTYSGNAGLYNAQLFVKDNDGLLSFPTKACTVAITVSCATLKVSPNPATVNVGDSTIATVAGTDDAAAGTQWTSNDPATVSITNSICTQVPGESPEEPQAGSWLLRLVRFFQQIFKLQPALATHPNCQPGFQPVFQGQTATLYGHKKGKTTIDVTDKGAFNCPAEIISVPADVVQPPWIQTTGGDVHSNIKISTPGGP